MINSDQVRNFVEEILRDKELFIVDVEVRKNNKILILVDSLKGISIDECAGISRLLEVKLDRDMEDFELEVSSPGLGSTFKVLKQYEKNIGEEIEITTMEHAQISGILKDVSDTGIIMEFNMQDGRIQKDPVEKPGTDIKRYIPFKDIKVAKAKVKFI